MLNKLKEKIANVLYEGVNNLLYWVKGVKIIEQYDVKHLIHSLDFGEDNQLNQVVDLSRLDKEGVAILMEYVAEEVVVDQIKNSGYTINDKEGVLDTTREIWKQPKVYDNVVLLRVRYKGKRGNKPIDRWEVVD